MMQKKMMKKMKAQRRSKRKFPEKKSFTNVYLAVAGAIFKLNSSDFLNNIPGPKVK